MTPSGLPLGLDISTSESPQVTRNGPMPPRFAVLLARLRALPTDNPRFACDALLIAADWCRDAAVHHEIARQPEAADAQLRFAAELRAVEARARTLAPVFAPPAEDRP